MTSYLQEVLTTLTCNASDPGVASPVSLSAVPPVGSPTSVSTLITFIFSLAVLRDWLKLIVFGGVLETCRRIISNLYSKLVSYFWMNAYFEEQDACYDWLMVWLSKQPSWKQSRNVQISTQTYGAKSSAIMLDGEENRSISFKSFRKLSYLPSLSVTYGLWYKGCYMSIIRTQEQTRWYGGKERTLHISILTRNRGILVQLLQEARKEYVAAQEHHMCIFVNSDSPDSSGWKHVACRTKRSITSVILEPGLKEMLLKDARDFLGSKPWYFERGIPFRRGYLLWGAPGSGKSSLIHALAGELGLDIYVITLGKAGLDDSSLNELINQLPERSIALMEDIDAVFTHGLTRDPRPIDVDVPADPLMLKLAGEPSSSPHAASLNRVTLSGLLNALDGVSAQEGRILFATTNKYSSIDSALRRPGRMDVHVEFKLASKYQAKEFFLRFFNPGDVPESSKDEHYSLIFMDSADSGHASLSSGSHHAQENFVETHCGNKHSIGELESLANEFSNAVPEYSFSMAALQGYLMMHKMDPLEAVKQVGEWLQKEKEDCVTKD